MNKRIIKAMKLGLALAAIFAAAPVRAEISMEMGVEGYAPGSYSRAAELRAQQLESLADAAERLEASVDAAGSEVLLAGLYSGSVAAENAAPVYAAAPVSMPARNVSRAVSVKSAIEEIGADEPAAGDAGAVAAADAEGGAADAGPAVSLATDSGSQEDDSKPTAGSMLLATLIVVALAFLLLYAPLLLVAL